MDDAQDFSIRSEPVFFRNYNRIIGMAYASILLGIALFFGIQLQQAFDDEIDIIHGHVERHGQFMEFMLAASAEQLEALRMIAGTAQTAQPQNKAVCTNQHSPDSRYELSDTANGFNRDAVSDRDNGGNLLGHGSLKGRSAQFYCDIDTAMALNKNLQSVIFNLPHIARVRFVSVHQFELISPWQPAAVLDLGNTIGHDENWQNAQIQTNPNRLRFWSAPYFAGEEIGLLAPVSAPVYDVDRFMGVISVETSLDYLNRDNSEFGYPLGTVSMVDAQGRIMANPTIFKDPLQVREPGHWGQAFKAETLASMNALNALPNAKAVTVGSDIVLRRAFVAAPWQLVFSVPRITLWEKILLARGGDMLAVLLGLALLMAVTYVVTSREFVGPAAKLVGYLVAESNFKPGPIPLVPQAWRPWFDAIAKAFRESLQLSSLRREIDIAAKLQQSILPKHWPEDTRFALWGTMRAAKDVGGDFYDHFEIDGTRSMVVADVSGKGISAGLFGMLSKTLLRSVAIHNQTGLGVIIEKVNDGLCEDNENCMFVTTFFARYDPVDGSLNYINAGHPAPILVRQNGQIEWLKPTKGIALGVMEASVFKQGFTQMSPGDLLLMYSDGVTEAINTNEEEFGNQRLADLFENQGSYSPEQAVMRVLKAVENFAQGAEQSDDITCLALSCAAFGANKISAKLTPPSKP
jgi:sigma-B regulation protein RsbU (phosphoserine phosphatase)